MVISIPANAVTNLINDHCSQELVRLESCPKRLKRDQSAPLKGYSRKHAPPAWQVNQSVLADESCGAQVMSELSALCALVQGVQSRDSRRHRADRPQFGP